MSDLEKAFEWRKSTFSNPSGNCVEIADQGMGEHGYVFVRNSRIKDGHVLAFTTDEFRAFVAGVKAGEFG